MSTKYSDIRKRGVELSKLASNEQESLSYDLPALCLSIGISIDIWKHYRIVKQRSYRQRGKGLKAIYGCDPSAWEAKAWHEAGSPEELG